jgi:acetoin utilization protein AcuB
MGDRSMRISDVMTMNVVSVPSDTSMAEARRIMEAHRLRRLPVIDRGKLVGIVTRDALDRMGPSKLTTFSIHEMSYMLNTMRVEEVMHRDVVTVSPEMYVDDAVNLAQSKGVGMLIAMEEGRVVGVVTTNDFFYKILNPILGVKIPGTRIYVHHCHEASDIEKVMAVLRLAKIKVHSLFLINIPEFDNSQDLVLHLNAASCPQCLEKIKELGFQITEKRH